MISLVRRYDGELTLGKLFLPDGSFLFTLELPWRNNAVGKSCIPEGQYMVHKDSTGRHRWWRIADVEGRTFIEIHEGSKPEHSEGCILMRKKDLYTLYDWFGDKSWILDIKEAV